MSSKRQELELINTTITTSQTVDFLVHPGDNVGVSVTHDDTTPSPLTFTAAVTDILTAASHGCATGLLGRVSAAATLPTGLTASTDYWLNVLDADTFEICTTLGNAVSGTQINITAAGSGTFTVTPATAPAAAVFTANDGTDVCTATAHGMWTGLKVQVSSDDTLPAGLSGSTDYWIIKTGDDTFQIASSLANASAGTQIDITSAGVGNHTVTPVTIAGAATFTVDVDTDVCTKASHGWVDGQKVQVSAAATLPGGLSAGTDYYVVNLGTNTLSLASSYANATAAVPVVIDITTVGSGTFTFTPTTGGARNFLLSMSLDGTNFTSSAFFNSNTATTFTAVTVSSSAATTLYQLSNLNVRKVRVAFTMADGQASIRLAMASSSNG